MEPLKGGNSLGVLLPNTKIYGGVKRFLEIGNNCCALGHRFYIFTPDGQKPTWFPFKGEVRKFDDLEDTPLDLLVFGQVDLLPHALTAKVEKIFFYMINPKEKLGKLTKYPHIKFFANSSGIQDFAQKKYGIASVAAFGGINLERFPLRSKVHKSKDAPFVVMVYGRISKPKKGTMKVVKACEKLYRSGHNVRLLLFDSPTDAKAERAIEKFSTKVPYDFVLNHPVEKNYELYHRADVFVSAESSGGWSNTSAEAMACGVPVIATEVGTRDFLIPNQTGILLAGRRVKTIKSAIEQVMGDEEQLSLFAQEGRKQIEKYDWRLVTDNVLAATSLTSMLHDSTRMTDCRSKLLAKRS